MRGWNGAFLVDREIADQGGVVACELSLDQVPLRIQIDIGVDQVGLIGAERRERLGRLLRKSCRRRDLVHQVFGHSLQAMDVGIILAFAGRRAFGSVRGLDARRLRVSLDSLLVLEAG